MNWFYLRQNLISYRSIDLIAKATFLWVNQVEISP